MNKIKHSVFLTGALIVLIASISGCTKDTLQVAEVPPNPPGGDTASNMYINLPERIPVLMYHYIGDVPGDQLDNKVRLDLTVSAKDFENHLKWLRENEYSTMSFYMVSDFVQANGKWPVWSSIAFPTKPIILSFDDGYGDAYTNAFPLLKKYGMTGVFAIITDKVGTLGYLTWDQIKEMQQNGMEFASHTVSHPDLRKISTEELKKELVDSKRILQEKLNMEIDGLVYPSGQYDEKTLAAIASAGYTMARTTKAGFVTKDSDPLELPVIRIHGGDSMKNKGL